MNFFPKHRILLGSGSPRRKQLLLEMGLAFEVWPAEIEETYPPILKGAEITDYLARKKADSLFPRLQAADILLTADTLVWQRDRSLSKPSGPEEAAGMLKSLSGAWHEVYTSVCLSSPEKQLLENRCTRVKFRNLEASEISYYIREFLPLDKAGAYGIQEWIGLVGIEEIQGSYTNVVGLPTQLVFDMLRRMRG